jgi:hypothetical protein
MMHKEEIEAIKRRCEAATRGPWKLTPLMSRNMRNPSAYLVTMPDGINSSDLLKNDAEFIAASREDVPALLAEVEKLRGLLSDVESNLIAGWDAL